MLERLTGEELVTAISLLGKALAPEVLVYLDQNVQEKVIDIIGPRALARAIPVLHSDDAVDILQELEEEDKARQSYRNQNQYQIVKEQQL